MTTAIARELRQRAYRELVLEAAEAEFAEHGFEGARMQNIAALAGLSVGTVYEVVGGKEALFSDVLTRRLPAILKAAGEAGAGVETAVERLVIGMQVYVDFMLAHSNWLRIHLFAHPWGIGPLRGAPEREAWEQGLDLHARVLAAGMDEGTVHQTDPTLLARSLAAIQQVHLAAWVTGGMQAPAQRVRDTIVELFRRSFLTDAGRRRTETGREPS